MGFVDAVKSVYTRYVDFSTRSSRSEYWWFVLFYVIAGIVLGIVDMIIGINILTAILMLGSIIPGIAVGVRRLHDIGRSGWWMLIGFIPLVNLLLIYWYVLPGEEGDNAWGSNPLGSAA
jgi:uncharacterized membrane protein YhaH (DUF805 family)